MYAIWWFEKYTPHCIHAINQSTTSKTFLPPLFIYNCVIRTQPNIWPLSKLLSKQYNVNTRCYPVRQSLVLGASVNRPRIHGKCRNFQKNLLLMQLTSKAEFCGKHTRACIHFLQASIWKNLWKVRNLSPRGYSKSQKSFFVTCSEFLFPQDETQEANSE